MFVTSTSGLVSQSQVRARARNEQSTPIRVNIQQVAKVHLWVRARAVLLSWSHLIEMKKAKGKCQGRGVISSSAARYPNMCMRQVNTFYLDICREPKLPTQAAWPTTVGITLEDDKGTSKGICSVSLSMLFFFCF